VPVKTGDMIYVPAGRVHALCGGVVVYEVQQTSDITYRIYDYDRVGADGKTRQLEVDKAVAVINFNETVDTDFTKSAIKSPYFTMEKLTVDGKLHLHTANKFVILCITAGEGEISSNAGSEAICQGETLLIPACLGEFVLTGKLEFLKIV
jgi:mannose-6-phosphate isomerase